MINLQRLKQVCSTPFKDFAKYGEVVYTGKSRKAVLFKGGAYIFQDNDSDILGVCHLDYVDIPYHFDVANLGGKTVFCPRLDDRLGVYLLLDVLPGLVGYPYDVLLTTGEELGRSSASYFEPPRVYSWIFELDRRGCDCVTYGLDSREFRAALGAAGWSISRGSFSDICLLDTQACAVNFGVGYRQEHTRLCHAFVDDVIKQVGKVAKFYNSNFWVPYVQQADYKGYQVASYGRGYDWGAWSHYEDDLDDVRAGEVASLLDDVQESGFCEFCGCNMLGDMPYYIDGAAICQSCYNYLNI